MAARFAQGNNDSDERQSGNQSLRRRKFPAISAVGECDFFCIHNYAVTNAKPCGWRGRFQETRSEASGLHRLCPNCGQASLLRIPHRE